MGGSIAEERVAEILKEHKVNAIDPEKEKRQVCWRLLLAWLWWSALLVKSIGLATRDRH